MSSLKQKLNYLKETKRLIGEAIKGKGGTLTSDFRGYADAIKNLPSGGGKISVKDTGIKFGNSDFTEVPEVFDFTGVTEMGSMFDSCYNLSKIPNINYNDVYNLSSTFIACYSLPAEISLTNTGNVQFMDYMFYGCYSLSKIELNAASAESMYGIFTDCSQLKTVLLTTSEKMNRFDDVFNGCTELESVSLIDCGRCEHVSFGWSELSKLTDIGGFKNLGKRSDFQNVDSFLNQAPNATVESLMNVINNLYDRKTAGYSVVSLSFGEANLGKLTPEQIAVATNKGWTLV